ncbi:YceI family protein [Legionella hackeliae]|uniref:YceI-like family protein n=1 Tax=Legionella hackeliae TaxID=449 RepID=A0A0A8UVB1_LEGHA|nr:YceI family protein [Legionella hackeliae]KTD15184.1 putative YceI-like family protein [Legionella hackeliae]CEK11451.1 YceI-like family protein [Legionella hackeliae]STX48223.1 putative YceI-like family protein [Legionella hackeliae]
MKINTFKTLVGLFFTLSSALANAAISEWEIIPNESKLSFTATQNNAPAKGEFKKFSGKILVDPENYKASSIEIIVDMTSLSASYSDLKDTLITSDWFNIKLFPTAEFKSSDFNKTGEKTYEANGTLTIRDKSAPVKLLFTANETSPGMALVEGETTLKRNTFGVGQGEWSSTNEIKDEVKVNFKIVAKKKS